MNYLFFFQSTLRVMYSAHESRDTPCIFSQRYARTSEILMQIPRLFWPISKQKFLLSTRMYRPSGKSPLKPPSSVPYSSRRSVNASRNSIIPCAGIAICVLGPPRVIVCDTCATNNIILTNILTIIDSFFFFFKLKHMQIKAAYSIKPHFS